MKPFRFAFIASFALATFAAHQAMALSEDDKSMNTASGAPRFSDPDDKTPGQAVYMQNGNAASGGEDSSAIRYDYDPSSGSYVPHRQK